ncbi:gem-associated protein 4 [Latimeria chalumnae]|uniref:Gem nuclear organelle associated protein 4 n=1 Tax=Latimeria chalumnae TaxID=7897 RepID=H3AFW1_LATCH|nr:PREDICTED: gem-associated protein 4 [Latimeria chalumnae]|eukprot:XP_014347692.1 PREDICTED: gem-associated protein 4 [Latimeria chalumnae]
MELGPWICCEQMAVVHGGFLLAEKQYHPKRLKDLTKSEWTTYGQPILHALEDIHKIASDEVESTQWTRKVIAIVWAKVLDTELKDKSGSEGSETVEKKWKEGIFFSMENMIPAINHTVLFELVKSLGASQFFVQLLLALPKETLQVELNSFVDHALRETSQGDMKFFLDVWWEIMKQREGQQDELVKSFGNEMFKYMSQEDDEFSQSSKRFKSDPDSLPMTVVELCIPSFLFETLKRMHHIITSYKLRCYALANVAGVLYVSSLPDNYASLPIEVYLQKLTTTISMWNSDKEQWSSKHSLTDKIKEAEREIRGGYATSNFKLFPATRLLGIGLLNDLLQSWSTEIESESASITEDNYETYRMKESIQCYNENLKIFQATGELPHDEMKIIAALSLTLSGFLERISSLVPAERDVHLMPFIVMTILNEKLERYMEICSLFASESSWAFSIDGWLDCLERNKNDFQAPTLILKLVDTLTTKISSSPKMERSKINKAKEIVLECFSGLSLSDKNVALLGVLSTYGERGLSAKSDVFVIGFQEELNMAFNCITHSKAESAIARVLFQHPEATLQKACHLAIVNLGAYRLLAHILKKFPALCFKGDSSPLTSNLLVNCLKGTVWKKLTSAKEESQFLGFITSLMEPCEDVGSELPSGPLLHPAELVKSFVVPYFTEDFSDMELCLKILNRAVKQKVENEAPEHWVMSCFPLPLIVSLCQFLDTCIQCWQENFSEPQLISLETKELIIENLEQICDIVGQVAEALPEEWSRSLSWLYKRTEVFDWTVRIRLRRVFGNHFKSEVPSALFEVCGLSDHEWMPLALPSYGAGTGLLAWMECCCMSEMMMERMLSLLIVNEKNPEEVNMFSKGFLVALIQVLPWCSLSEWKRLGCVVKSLLQRELLHVPYSLEYVDFMPLLNLRPFAHDLQFSLLLLRAFQLLCSCSCSDWLPVDGWKHVARLCGSSMAEILESIKSKLAPSELKEQGSSERVQEAIFVFIQLFCHVLHIMAMMTEGTTEPLYFVSLEFLSQYEALCVADRSNSCLKKANEKHFLQSIAENVTDNEQRTALLQKISKI